jgi:hypothetical protein
MFGWIPKSSVRATGGINRTIAPMHDFLSLGFQGRSPWLYLDAITSGKNAVCRSSHVLRSKARQRLALAIDSPTKLAEN